ncbi:hypothetical protein [Euzebya sp.]|uniref:hypothetical protein n=1 Tax=Euzebya sp. TaxID=1971409 RepID=UPI0035187116
MRHRLVLATVGTVAVGVVLLGLPLAIAIDGVLTGQALDTLQRQAEQVQVLINTDRMTPRQLSDPLADRTAERDIRFQLLEQRGPLRITIDTGGPPAVPEGLETDVASAAEGEVGRARDHGVLAVALPLRVSGVSQILRAVSPDSGLKSELTGAWLAIAGLGVTALGLAGLVGLGVARRLAIPLESRGAAGAWRAAGPARSSRSRRPPRRWGRGTSPRGRRAAASRSQTRWPAHSTSPPSGSGRWSSGAGPSGPTPATSSARR